jgi:hypothetical protein
MHMSKKLLISACATAMFAAVNVNPARAQGPMPLDNRTEFTFNAPVELPGVTLPPGTYVFRFVDATTQKKVMQVATKADNKNYGMFLTINAIRPKPSDDAELRFMETPAGTPAAVKTWWYPGETIGREFIYPKAQAHRLAAATNNTVLTTKSDAETAPATTTANADLQYVSPAGQESAVTEDMLNAVNGAKPTGAPANTLSNAPVQENTSASNMNNSSMNNGSMNNASRNNASSSRQSLPRTNTMLPLFALMGVSSLAGGASLRFRR